MHRLLASLVLGVIATSSAAAELVIKIINFTADWCPNCQILNPRMDEAIEAFDAGAIEHIDLDATNAPRGTPMIDRLAVQTDAIELAGEHNAAYLWDWYSGATGIAVAVAADTGEPLTCFMRPMTATDIQDRLELAKTLTEHGKPGARSQKVPTVQPRCAGKLWLRSPPSPCLNFSPLSLAEVLRER